MAKSSNLPAKKYKAGERTATKIRLFADWDGQSGGPDHNHKAYVDLGQCLSVMNQRAYRQGLYYYVAGITVFNSETATNRVVFSTAPDTWVTKAAWARGWKAWMQMQREAMRHTGAIQAQYADFKVYLDDDHKATETATTLDLGNDDTDDTNTVDQTLRTAAENLLPIAYDKLNADAAAALPTPLVSDAWHMSEYVASDHGAAGGANQSADSFTAHIVGGHEGTDGAWDSVGLIKSLWETRPLRQTDDPNLYSDDRVEDDPIISVFDHGDTHEQVVKDIVTMNDRPPYNYDQPFGFNDDELYQVGQAVCHGGGGTGSISRIPGFCVPFGLLRIDAETDGGLEIVIDMVPGPYNGVYAERVI